MQFLILIMGNTRRVKEPAKNTLKLDDPSPEEVDLIPIFAARFEFFKLHMRTMPSQDINEI
jgi:hypothetical protein